MERKRIAFHTLGCKLNFAETSGLSRDLQEDCDLIDFGEIADYYVIQSCTVTAAAEKKCRSVIRQAHKRNPRANIVVLGCMSQLRADALAVMEGVNLVLGNSEKFQLRSILRDSDNELKHKVRVSNILKNKMFYPSISGSDRTRSFVKIQDGCDYFCKFCTIPLARGHSRSDNIAKTMEFIHSALKNKPREIILTGVNIGDFGKEWKESLYELLLEIDALDVQVRFRLSSIEPDLLNEDIIRLVANSGKFMPHFHIPLQAGAESVLMRMSRRYKPELFISRVKLIKQLMPFACIAADVIAGFPGETQDEFMQTYRLIESAQISYLHVFPYSERPGTLASSMADKVEPEIIHQRVKSLMELSDNLRHAFLRANKGRIEEVLFESENHDGFITGFTRNYIKVRIPFRLELVNTVIKTKLSQLADGEPFVYEAVEDPQKLLKQVVITA